MFYFYTPWKRQKTFGFQTFSEGIEMKQVKIGYTKFHTFICEVACNTVWTFLIKSRTSFINSVL